MCVCARAVRYRCIQSELVYLLRFLTLSSSSFSSSMCVFYYRCFHCCCYTCEQAVEDGSDGPNIHLARVFRADRGTANELRAGEVRSATGGRHSVGILLRPVGAQTEVGDFDEVICWVVLVGTHHEDIFRLEISVAEAVAVHIYQRVEYLACNQGAVGFRLRPPLFQAVIEVATCGQWEHDIERWYIRAELVRFLRAARLRESIAPRLVTLHPLGLA